MMASHDAGFDQESVRCPRYDRELGVGRRAIEVECVLEPDLVVVRDHHKRATFDVARFLEGRLGGRSDEYRRPS
jgi:hypothetical protein